MADLATKRAPTTQQTRDTFKRIRRTLNQTQGELAEALCVSKKAVQSYEQGWRRVPVRVMRELITLLVLNRGGGRNGVPCWTLMDCPKSIRNRCAAHRLTHGRFCWLSGSQTCRTARNLSPRDALPCVDCDVIRQYL